MIFKKILTWLIIYLCSFQLAFSDTLYNVSRIARAPAAYGYIWTVEELEREMTKFKGEIHGKEKNCEESEGEESASGGAEATPTPTPTPAVPPIRVLEVDNDILLKPKTLISKMVYQPGDNDVYEFNEGERKRQIYFLKDMNASFYLSEVMARKKIRNIKEVVSSSLESRLKATKIHIPFPPLHGSAIWRSWGLRVLGEFARDFDNIDTSTRKGKKLVRIITRACSRQVMHVTRRLRVRRRTLADLKPGNPLDICAVKGTDGDGNTFYRNLSDASKIMANIYQLLKPFVYQKQSYVPYRQLHENDFREGYDILGRIWDKIQNSTDFLAETKPTEFEYLMAQLEAQNPWARLRLGYLIALEEYDQKIADATGATIGGESSGESSGASAEACQVERIPGLIEKIAKEINEKEKKDLEEDIDEIPAPFRADNPDITRLHRQGLRFKLELEKYLEDEDVAKDVRKKLLISYLDKVVLPMRDIMVISRRYVPNEYRGTYFYVSLLPEFPTELYPPGSEERKVFTLGPNPALGYLHLEIIDQEERQGSEDNPWQEAAGVKRSKVRFNEKTIIFRDVQTLMKAPTVRNYLYALKWLTLQMMLQQIYFYSAMSGRPVSRVHIPRSCRNHFNAELPPYFDFKFKQGEDDAFMEKILSKHGMVFMEGSVFEEYYLKHMNKDPTKDGYSGTLPFEEYRNAIEALSKRAKDSENYMNNHMIGGRYWTRPGIDDHAHFQQVVNMKMGQAMENFKEMPAAQCDTQYYQKVKRKFIAAGKKLGITNPLYPSHASHAHNTRHPVRYRYYNPKRFMGVLNKDERKYFWTSIESAINERNINLFSEETPADKRKYYDIMEDITYKTLLTQEHVDQKIPSLMPGGIGRTVSDEIKKILGTSVGKLGDFFYKLYEQRGNVKEQDRLFAEFSKKNGIDTRYKVKSNFLALDNSIKVELYKSLMKMAANFRKGKVERELGAFCELQANKNMEIRAIFYATAKAQNKLNEMLGLPGVPEKVIDKVTEMSDDEVTDIWMGVGSALLMIGALVIGAFCTGVTGGLCAPLAAGMIVAAYTSLYLQVKLVSREMRRKRENDEYEAQIRRLEALDFTTEEYADEMHRSWFWTIFEGICIIPLIGVVGRSTSLGLKLGAVSAAAVARRSGKMAFKQAARTATAEADVKLARYVLEFDTLARDVGIVAREGAEEAAQEGAEQMVKGTQDLTGKLATGEIGEKTFLRKMGAMIRDFPGGFLRFLTRSPGSLKDYAIREFGSVAVRESVEEIDKRAAKIVSRYFRNRPEGMYNFFKTYSGKRLQAAVEAMEKVKVSKEAAKELGRFRRFLKWFPRKWRELRHAHLAEQADKITKLDKALEALAKSGGSLEDFILKNMDDLTDVFIKIPMRKLELPYMVLLQGGPHIGGPLWGRAIPGFSRFADGIILRKFFNARARLVYESVKREAREVLRLAPEVASETTFQAFKAFRNTVYDSACELAEAEGKIMLQQQAQLEEAMAQKIFAHYQTNFDSTVVFKVGRKKKAYKFASAADVQRIVFSPKNLEEEALAQVIWQTMRPKELFPMSGLSEMAHRAMRELKNYQSIDEFDNYLNSLRILTIQRDPGVVELL